MTPAEVAATPIGCILCGRNPIVAIGCVIPVDDVTYAALMKLRELPVSDDQTPTLRYGLCAEHARHFERSATQAHAKILAAAAQVRLQ